MSQLRIFCFTHFIWYRKTLHYIGINTKLYFWMRDWNNIKSKVTFNKILWIQLVFRSGVSGTRFVFWDWFFISRFFVLWSLVDWTIFGLGLSLVNRLISGLLVGRSNVRLLLGVVGLTLVLDVSSETSLKIEIQSNYFSYVIRAKMWLNYVRISLVSDDLTTTIGQSDVIRATHDFAVGFFLATLLSDKISFLFN